MAVSSDLPDLHCRFAFLFLFNRTTEVQSFSGFRGGGVVVRHNRAEHPIYFTLFRFHGAERKFTVPVCETEHADHHRRKDSDNGPQEVEKLVESFIHCGETGIHFRPQIRKNYLPRRPYDLDCLNESVDRNFY